LTFNLFQTVLISGLINAMVLFVSLRQMDRRYRKPALFLGLFILGYLIYQAEWLLIPDIQRNLSFIIPSFPVLYFLPALFFFFVKSVFNPEVNHVQRYTWLLIPGGLDILYSISSWIYIQDHKSGALYDFITGRIGFLVYEGLAALFSLVIVGYLVIEFMNREVKNNPTYQFFRFILLGVVIILCRWVILLLTNLMFPKIETYHLQQLFWVLETLLLFYIGYKVVTAPKVLNVNYSGYQSPDEGVLKKDAKKLLETLTREKEYLNPNLSRKELAKSINRTEVHVSQVLKEGLNTSFYDLINSLRIGEAIRLIEQGVLDKETVESLAKQVGYNSKNTFYKAFRKMTGTTPSAYHKADEG